MTAQQYTAIRSRLGLTQKQMAALLGVSMRTVENYSGGRKILEGHAQLLDAILFMRAVVTCDDGIHARKIARTALKTIGADHVIK